MARSLDVRFKDGGWVVKRGRDVISRHLTQQDAIDLALAKASEGGLRVFWTNALGEAWRIAPARGGWFSGVLRGSRLGSRSFRSQAVRTG